MAWVTVPTQSFDGLPQGFTVRTKDEYIIDLRQAEREQQVSVDVSTNEISKKRVKPNKVTIRKLNLRS